MDIDSFLAKPGTRPALIVVAVLVALHLIAAITLVSLRAATGDQVLAGTAVDGEDVGGLDEAALTQVVTDRAEERLARPVEVTTEESTASSPREELGAVADTAGLIDDAWSRGRTGFYTALGQQLGARFGVERDIDFRVRVDKPQLRAWAEDTADELSRDPQPGRVHLAVDDDGSPALTTEAATDGLRVDAGHLGAEVARRVDEPGLVEVTASTEELDEPTDQDDLDNAVTAAQLALSDDVRLDNPSGGDDVELAPAALAEVLEVGFDADAPAGQRLPVTSDEQRLTDHLGRTGVADLADEPREADLELADGEVTVVDGTPGIEPDLDAAAALIVELSAEPDDRTGELPGDTEDPELLAEPAQQALDDSGLSIADPVELTNPSDGDDLVLDPDDLEVLLTAGFVERDGQPQVEVSVDDEDLTDHLDGQLDALAPDPVEASVEVSGGSVSRSGGTSGFSLDIDDAADLIADLVTDDDRTDELPGEIDQPRFTAELAATIQEEVSSFTTPLTPGQDRNDNIARAVELIDGDVILPGERYSLNEGIGERTEERGFGENGFIDDGELVSTVGGGISQVATTFLNTAWFAGIDLVTFTPHSQYFQRYPEGREATLAWGVLDVVVENDSPYAIQIVTDSSDSDVTIAFWSTAWAEVSTDMGDRYDEEEGEARDGFSIDFSRTITEPDGTTRVEEYTHTYQPADDDE